MIKLFGVRFEKIGKIHFFKDPGLVLKVGDDCIVKTIKGLEYGRVVLVGDGSSLEDYNFMGELVRKASEDDKYAYKEKWELEDEAFKKAVEKIKSLKLSMKLLKVKYLFDQQHVVFSFRAEEKVDFRELVKYLSKTLNTRVEMRQVGVRDEAKMIGGLGSCGRETCCSTFLSGFDSVAIKMAKEQGLSLNPSKISGLCGRLMCCLRYENSTYVQAKRGLPKLNSTVKITGRRGKLERIDVLSNKVTVKFEEGERETFSINDFCIMLRGS
ncbi:MAG: regulatory iron-sulfur-containing complex subunit RicT [bacterium]|jgi:cell fate regulator YaaT (PSP1 superfamily)|nr:regulatory iron-sulfur-containing complex subunit RicT [bacterium]